MILLAVAVLTIFQPGFWFAPMMRKGKQRQQWDNMHGPEPSPAYQPMQAPAGGQPYDPMPPPQPYGPAQPWSARP